MSPRQKLHLAAHNAAATISNDLSVTLQETLWRQFGNTEIQKVDLTLKKKVQDAWNEIIKSKNFSPDVTVWPRVTEYSFTLKVRANRYSDKGNASVELTTYLFRLNNKVLSQKEDLPFRRGDWADGEVEQILFNVTHLESLLSAEKSKLPFESI